MKQRLRKTYRHPDLDARLLRERTKGEAANMKRALKFGVPCPEVIYNDHKQHLLTMTYVENSLTLKAYLNHLIHFARDTLLTQVLEQAGRVVLKMHNHNLIHGDLTTSNLMVRLPKEQVLVDDHQALIELLKNGQPSPEIVVIDFGLTYQKAHAPEHKAVDLYVLERAFISTHPSLEKEFKVLLGVYEGKEVLDRLEEVRARGRKKLAFG